MAYRSSEIRGSLTAIFLVAFTAVSVGCEDTSLRNQEEGSLAPITDATMQAFGSPPQDSLSPGDVDAENIAEETVRFEEAANSASDWREADREVQDLLTATSSIPTFVLEQSAAYAMFREFFTTDQWQKNFTQEKREALAFYTSLLVENRSPESHFVYTGLKHLEGHWSPEQIKRAAETALEAAERKYGSGPSETKAGSSGESEPTPGLAESREQHARRVVEANQKIEGLLSRLSKDG